MRRFLEKLFGASTQKKGAIRRFIPAVEALEQRLVMSGLDAHLDYTQVAQMFPRHVGPTNLYLNFDGWVGENVDRFVATYDDGNPATNERERDIQDIIFRVSEIFSPFDVQVRRIHGNGVHAQSGGASTIFIGDACRFGTGTDNQSGGVTPGKFMDMPGDNRGFSHIPNSDAYDIAFVDPVAADPIFAFTNTDISRVIAHEAGHTFGLGHSANPPSGSPPDAMSYDADNKRFVDQWLPLTNRNFTNGKETRNNGILPGWRKDGDKVYLFQQNSFRFLEAVLGSRPADDSGNVTHAESVDKPQAPKNMVGTSATSGAFVSQFSGVIDRYGDYDVFRYRAQRTENVTIRVQSGAFLGLQSPEIMTYPNGNLSKFSFVPAGKGTALIALGMSAGQTVEFVVGTLDGGIGGTYQLSITGQLVGQSRGDYASPGGAVDGQTNKGDISNVLSQTTLVTATPTTPPLRAVGAGANPAAKNAARDAVFANLARPASKNAAAVAFGTALFE